jgi:hypothetical protein
MLQLFILSSRSIRRGSASRNATRFFCLTLWIFFLSFAMAGCTKEKNEMVTIVKNCTGVYIQIEGKHFLVCNEEVFANIDNGSSKRIVFKKVKSCKAKNDKEIVCTMYFQHEGKVEVLQVD